MTVRQDLDELSENVHDRIAKLEVEMHELRFEANFNRATTLIVFLFVVERLWHYFF